MGGSKSSRRRVAKVIGSLQAMNGLSVPAVNSGASSIKYALFAFDAEASEVTRGTLDTSLAHLGSGSNLAAAHGGKPIDTTMGLTPVGGIVMSTRPGDLGAGVLIYSRRTTDVATDHLEDGLSDASGLRGHSSRRLEFLGVRLDQWKNAAHAP
jgi:acetate kinase